MRIATEFKKLAWSGSSVGTEPDDRFHYGAAGDYFIYIGDGKPYRSPRPSRVRNPKYEFEVPGYAWPEEGVDAIVRSFNQHAVLRKAAITAMEPICKEDLDRLSAKFAASHPLFYERPSLPGEGGWDETFRRALYQLECTSSPGLGAFEGKATIGDALGWDGLRYCDVAAVETLKAYVETRIAGLCQVNIGWPDPDGLADEPCSRPGIAGQTEEGEAPLTKDDIKVFIKGEPHKLSKIETGRFRVIWSFSLVDQMVDKILFSPWIHVEVDNVGVCVSKTGWSPLPSGYRNLLASFPSEDRSLAVDKSAWDWTMPAWVAKLYYQNKIDQCTNASEDYIRATANRFREVLCDAVVRLPDGARYLQNSDGLMKSGWLLTLSCNSAAQFYQHQLAWARSHRSKAPPMWAMGDDSLISLPAPTSLKDSSLNVEAYLTALGKTGCVVKQAEFSREFAGFRFGPDSVVPLYQDKHKFMLNYVSPDAEQEVLMSYHLVYALAKNNWLKEIRKYCNFPVGSHFASWARGLIRLDLLDELPLWLN